MSEIEAFREREAEPKTRDLYDELQQMHKEEKKRAESGAIVIRGKDQPWEQSRQGQLKHFLHPKIETTALFGWMVFLQRIHTHSGRHRHQGGLVIYVVEGKGCTTVNDKRYDWEGGDLILLPITPGGVEHQHFNVDPDKAVRLASHGPHAAHEPDGQLQHQADRGFAGLAEAGRSSALGHCSSDGL